MVPLLGIEDVHEALLSLYSPTELARSTVARATLAAHPATDVVEKAQAVRDLILDAIESLRPSGHYSSASASRAYDCLTYRYVTGMSVEDVAYELHLSPRQVYRDLRWGEERLVEILASRQEQHPAGMLRQELLSVAQKPEPVDLAETVQTSAIALTALAERLGARLEYAGPASGLPVYATPGLLRSVLAQVLSGLLQSSGDVRIALTSDSRMATLEFCASGHGRAVQQVLSGAPGQMLQAQGIDHSVCSVETQECLLLAFPLAAQRQLLVVEDNPGACALYERYLESTEWQSVTVDSPSRTAQVAVTCRPDAILLDIMMPETDGWSVLQDLRLNPLTRGIPVIICSVLSDPELAAALGATAYLSKPVSRSQLLACLKEAVPVRRQA